MKRLAVLLAVLVSGCIQVIQAPRSEPPFKVCCFSRRCELIEQSTSVDGKLDFCCEIDALGAPIECYPKRELPG